MDTGVHGTLIEKGRERETGDTREGITVGRREARDGELGQAGS